MPTPIDFNNIHVAQFKDNIELLSQQMTPRIAGRTRTMSCVGKQAQSVVQISSVDPSDYAAPGYGTTNYTGGYADTEWDTIEHTQRWVLPTMFKAALPIARQDMTQMLADPRSAYARELVAGFNRKRDDLLIAAALGNAKKGPFDTLADQALPAAQILNAAVPTTATPLTIDLLLDTWEKLTAAEAVNDGEKIYFATDAAGLRQLLNTTEVKSADYNTVKALAAGELNSFMGFEFLRSERLPTITNAGTGNFNQRKNFAFVESGLTEGIWEDRMVRIDERSDKNYVWQIFMEASCGFVRNEDVKVVQANTTVGAAN